jgi:tetratricopeptide (TPR) repeat protein
MTNKNKQCRWLFAVLLCRYAAILLIGYACGTGVSAAVLPGDMHTLAMTSIDLAYRDDFKQAQSAAKRLIKEYPSHPAGYFFMAAVLDARMEQFHSRDDELEFYKYCDLAVSKGEEMVEKSPDDIWARFFMGGANGARGTYESRYNRWITAFRFGWQGVSAFKDLLTKFPDMKDALMGVATYDYWRSAMTRTLWWMPGVQDKREESINLLQDVIKTGTYTKDAASRQLISILNNEKRYTEALELSARMLTRYPSYLVFHWGKVDALMGLKRYEEAENNLKYILIRMESENISNHYGEVHCHFYMAKLHFLKGNYPSCLSECIKVEGFNTDTDTRKRLEPQLIETAAMKKKSETKAK